MEEKPSQYMEDLYTVKVVVFMETSPQTDNFQQVVLTPEQRADMMQFLTKLVSKKGEENFVVVTNNEHQYKFPEIMIDYEPQEVQKFLSN